MGKYVLEGTKVSFFEEYYHRRIGTEVLKMFCFDKEELARSINECKVRIFDIDKQRRSANCKEDNFLFAQIDANYEELRSFERALKMFNCGKSEMTDREFSEIEEEEDQ